MLHLSGSSPERSKPPPWRLGLCHGPRTGQIHVHRQDRRTLVNGAQERLDELVAARDQMEQLVRAIVAIGSDLDLDVTLQRLVNAATELSGARYGALGVCAPDGALGSFVRAGIGNETAHRLAALPVGDGLRVDDVSAHPQAARLYGQDP